MAKTNRISRKFRVTVDDRSTVVLAETSEAAIELAISKLFGRDCFWHPDSGIKNFGQVFRYLGRGQGSNAVTGRVRLDVEALAPKSPAFLAQEARDHAEATEAYTYFTAAAAAEESAWQAGYRGEALPADPDLAQFHCQGKQARQDALEQQAATEAAKLRERELALQRLAAWQQVEATKHAAILEREREIVAAELARLQSIDAGAPITDPVLVGIVRNAIAGESFPRGTLPFGEWKRQLLAGRHPSVIAAFLTSPRAIEKLANKINNP